MSDLLKILPGLARRALWLIPWMLAAAILGYFASWWVTGTAPSVLAVAAFASVVNPPVLLGTALVVCTWPVLSRRFHRTPAAKKAQGALRGRARVVARLHRLVAWSGRWLNSSVFVYQIALRLVVNARLQLVGINPTRSAAEDAALERRELSLRIVRASCDFALAHLTFQSDEARQDALAGALEEVSKVDDSLLLQEIVQATDKDGAGFLSTMTALFNLVLLNSLPEDYRAVAVRAIGATLSAEKARRLGWLGHRFMDAGIQLVCRGFAENQIASVLRTALQRFEDRQVGRELSQSDLETLKWSVRDYLVQVRSEGT